MKVQGPYQPVPPVASLHELGVSVGQRVILERLDLQLPQTGVDVLMGPAGCGKSLLLQALACKLPTPEQAYGQTVRQWGQMQLQGLPISPQWRPAWTGQHFSPPAGSLMQALLNPGPPLHRQASLQERHLAAAQALGSCGLGALVTGLDKPLAQVQPSRQRAVCILAQALASPSLMLIDEPTQGLEESEALWLITWLAALGRRSRLMVVLHHQGHARRLGERIVLLGGGRVLAHESTVRFFQYPPNEWAQEFVRTGGISIAAPRGLAPPSAKPPAGPLMPKAAPAPAPVPAPAAAIRGPAPSPAHKPLPAPASARTPVRASAPASPASGRFELLPGSWRERGPQSAEQGAAARKLSGADFSDTMPGARLGMAPKPSPAPLPATQAPHADSPTAASTKAAKGLTGPAAAGFAPNPTAKRRAELGPEPGPGPDGFCWVLSARLASCLPPRVGPMQEADLHLLAQAGVQVLVSLCEQDRLEAQVLARHGLHSLHLPVFDHPTPGLVNLERLAAHLQTRLDAGQALALFCSQGQGCTGTALAAWMMCVPGLSARQALARLNEVSPDYAVAPAQATVLLRLQQALKRTQAGP